MRNSDRYRCLFNPFSCGIVAIICWLLPVMNAAAQSGTVKSFNKISLASKNFGGVLDDGGSLGRSICAIGDLDGDGIKELAIGIKGNKSSNPNRRDVCIIYLNADGSLKPKTSQIWIPSSSDEFDGPKIDYSFSIASLGDLNNDKIPDLVVGSPENYKDTLSEGAIWILLMNADGSIKAEKKIGHDNAELKNELEGEDNFGSSIAVLKDLNGDNIPDLAVGACRDDDGYGNNHGAIYILFLTREGNILKYQKISQVEGKFKGSLSENELFGTSLANIGDLNKDGVEDLAVGSYFGDGSHPNSGAVRILFLNSDGTVKSHTKITVNKSNYSASTGSLTFFGKSVTSPGDLNQDGIQDLVIGANDKKNEFRGELWVAFMDRDGTASSFQNISSTKGGFKGKLNVADQFGHSIAAIGDLDKNGIPDIAVGAMFDDDGGPNRGAVWILKMAKSAAFKGVLMFNYDNPIRDLKFRLLSEAGEELQVTRTNTSGEFEFSNLTLGKKYEIELFSDEISLSSKSRMYIRNDKGENVLIIPKSEFDRFIVTPKTRGYYNKLKTLPPSDKRLITITVKGQLFNKEPGDLPDGASVFITNNKQQVIFATNIDAKGNFVFKRQSPKESYSIRSMAGEGDLKLLVKNNKGEIVFEAKMDQNGKIIYNRFKPGEKTVSFTSVDNETITVRDGRKFNLNIYFKPGSSLINEEAAEVLDKVVSLLKRNSQIAIEISAHTDSKGSDEQNLTLSYKRAEQVVMYVYKKGIPIKRINGNGFGETQLLNKCDDGVSCTEAEHKINRRVELIIRKYSG